MDAVVVDDAEILDDLEPVRLADIARGMHELYLDTDVCLALQPVPRSTLKALRSFHQLHVSEQQCARRVPLCYAAGRIDERPVHSQDTIRRCRNRRSET